MRTLRENWVLLIPTSGLSALLPSDDESYVYTSAFSAAFAQHSTVYKIIVSKLSTDACKLTVHVVLNFKEMIIGWTISQKSIERTCAIQDKVNVLEVSRICIFGINSVTWAINGHTRSV